MSAEENVRLNGLSALANDVAFDLGILEAAQGMEAQRAATGTGAVHDSPTPQGDAP